MTATPIPRTLSLTAYGDLDTTALRELPAGRQPVETWVVGEEKRAGAYEFIRERLREGRQAFVVCPLVDGVARSCRPRRPSEEAERLRARRVRATSRSALLHGQMPSAREGGGDGARSPPARPTCWSRRRVIEVGIDVANATVMVIEGAERFGALPAAPAARPGRPRRARLALHPVRRRRARSSRGAGSRRSPPSATASSSPRSTWPARRGRDPRHPPARPAALRGRRAARGHADSCSRRASEVLALLRRHGSLDAPELGPLLDAARRALRRRARRADRA